MKFSLDPIWVDSDQRLAELCEKWSQQAAIAVDTEFMRVSTFYPIPGLIQVGDGEGCYLIDPQAVREVEPLRQLLVNPAVTKVVHSCSEDLEVFRHYLGVLPRPLFDTQIAAAFAGCGFSIGYAGLIKSTLGVELDKGETRSDWLQRPLTPSQQKYAAQDVGYLLVAYGKLLTELRRLERLDWVRDDCAELGQSTADDLIAEAWRKVKSSWKLNRRELAILQELSLWREKTARERDIPRNRLMKERALWEMAKRKPRQVSHLFTIDGLLPRVIHAEGETLLQLIERGLSRPEAELPERLDPPLPPAAGDLLKALKASVRELAETMQLPSEVLMRKKDYEHIVRSGMKGESYQLPPKMSSWRRELLAERLLEVATSFKS